MRVNFLLLAVLSTTLCFAQKKQFPHDWQGNWKGELLWHQRGNSEPKKVMMQLSIKAIDSSYTWHLSYDNAGKDSRPYKLVPKDMVAGHWQIDENNGIIIDMYFVGNRLTGAFTVGSSTIITSYWLEAGKLIAEFHNISGKPINSTGLNTEESPTVQTYSVRSYQRAELSRQ